jgi:hypothetical protein
MRSEEIRGLDDLPRVRPASPHEIDVAYSLVLTDHYFSREALDQISSDMQRGLPRPSLPPEQEAAFLSQAREFLQSPMGSLLTSARSIRGST